MEFLFGRLDCWNTAHATGSAHEEPGTHRHRRPGLRLDPHQRSHRPGWLIEPEPAAPRERERGYVARIYRAWVTQERLEGIQSVRATLRAAGLPFTQTRPSADG